MTDANPPIPLRRSALTRPKRVSLRQRRGSASRRLTE
jgi:hypothetical protein